MMPAANSRAMLSSVFAKMDLVTREELDVQSQVLLRTHEKLAELEAKLATLENIQSGCTLPRTRKAKK